MMRPRYAAVFAVCAAGAFVSPVGGRVASEACAASEVHIAVVVDSGSGSSVSAVCVPAGAQDNGAIVLATRASMLGTPQPRYATSGLLCAIDGFPATGCGEPHNGHYSYWSYWHGRGGAWSYANIGPATSRVDPDVVEGWRWEVNGSASPADPPPRVAPVASAICKPAAAPPPTTAAPPAPATVNAAGAPTPPANAPGAGPDAATSRGPGTAPGRTAAGTRPTTHTGKAASSGTTNPRTPRRTASTSPRAHGADASPSTTVALAAGGIAQVKHTSGSGGVPVGLVVGGILVAALFAGGVIAARRRRAPT
jgi:hypothetical protein